MAISEYSTKPKGDAIIAFKFKDATTISYEEGVKLAGKEPDFKAGRQESYLVTGKKNVIFVGLGDKKNMSIPRLLEAVYTGVQEARNRGFEKVGILVDDLGLESEIACARITEAALVSARTFTTYFMRKKKDIKIIKKIIIICPPQLKRVFEESLIISEAVNEVRDLQDSPPSDIYPDSFAKKAKVMAAKHGIKCSIFDEKKLKRMGYNAILNVGRGSANPPRLVVLDYNPAGASKTVCLVGKGITFDSGGYNLKPGDSMYDMKHDMSGAAVVYGVIKAVASLRIKTRVIGILGLAENLIGSRAYKPSDIIRTAAGISVEFKNTDAEGRLVLADSLSHASKYEPDFIIDFATLTGACIVALGSVCSAIMGNNKKLINSLIRAGDITGERLWELPLFEEYEDDIDSKIADIKNIGYKREAGTITAAQFLKQFVKGKWAHIDIAGTAMVERPRFMTEEGGTGFGVRMMIEWLKTEI